jgi:hypothetical protein
MLGRFIIGRGSNRLHGAMNKANEAMMLEIDHLQTGASLCAKPDGNWNLGAVIEDLARLPRRITLKPIAETQLIDIDASVGNGGCSDIRVGSFFPERHQL